MNMSDSFAGNTPCTVVSPDFLLVGKLQTEGMLNISRVLSGLDSTVRPENQTEILVIDVRHVENHELEQFLISHDQDFAVVVILVERQSQSSSWLDKGAIVVSLDEWLGTSHSPEHVHSTANVELAGSRGHFHNKPHIRNQIIAFFCPKGGVGRTTLAVNMACRARQILDIDVLIVDLDIGGGDVAVHLNTMDSPTIVDLLAYGDDLTPEMLLEFAAVHQSSGLHVLPSPGQPELVEMTRWERLAPVLKACQRTYDLIIVDTSPDPASEINYHMAELATIIVAPVVPDVSAPRKLKQSIESFRESGADITHKVYPVINRHYDGIPVAEKDIARFLEMKHVAVFSEMNARVVESINAAKPLVLNDDEEKIRKPMDYILQKGLGVSTTDTEQKWWRKLIGYFRN